MRPLSLRFRGSRETDLDGDQNGRGKDEQQGHREERRIEGNHRGLT